MRIKNHTCRKNIIQKLAAMMVMAAVLTVCVLPALPASADTELTVAVKEYMDIATVDDSVQDSYNYVDITVPDDGQTHYVVMWIHGGSWVSGSRKDTSMDNTKRYLLNNGYAFVSADYCLNAVGTNPDGSTAILGSNMRMIYDIKAAVRFLRAHAAEYNLNTDYIFCMGGSAGATLALLMGTTNGNASYEDLTMGNADYSSDVQAVGSYYGPTYFSADDATSGNKQSLTYGLLGEWITLYPYDAAVMATTLSPLLQLSETSVPMYFTHAADDNIVPVTQSTMMSDAATNMLGSDKVGTKYYESGGHGGEIFDTDDAAVLLGDFIDAQLERTLHPEAVTDDASAGDTADAQEETADAAAESTEDTQAAPASEETTAVAAENPFMNIYAILLILLIAVGDVLLIYIAKRK